MLVSHPMKNFDMYSRGMEDRIEQLLDELEGQEHAELVAATTTVQERSKRIRTRPLGLKDYKVNWTSN